MENRRKFSFHYHQIPTVPVSLILLIAGPFYELMLPQFCNITFSYTRIKLIVQSFFLKKKAWFGRLKLGCSNAIEEFNTQLLLFSWSSKKQKWATSWQNQQNGLCAQRRLRSAWASAQSDFESSLSAWRMLGSLATHWVHSEDSDQTGQTPRLIWVFAGRPCHFVGFCHEMAQISKSNRYLQHPVLLRRKMIK